MDKNAGWQWEISAHRPWFRFSLHEIFQYKDLILRFVRRDIIASYQQTILGPVWVFLQPLFTTLVYFIIFHRVAKIPTDNVPPFLFYLPGIIIWSYFADCISSTMNTFQNNAYIFNKVYFPRLIVPLSSVLFHSFRISIQLLLFLGVYVFYMLNGSSHNFSWLILFTPLMIFITACFALGCGLIISVMTAKYRDLDNIMQFMMRLFMFAAPVVYPASLIPAKYKFLFWLNPLTPVIELFRSAFFRPEPQPFFYLLLSMLTTSIVLMTGIFLFNKREIQIMDVI
ncbi:MAG TPA: ABC transporter permease [Puia sp.]|jgi:lipopolysaccharide transport system permease protein